MRINLPDPKQHDNHCWMTFQGQNWTIKSVCGDCIRLVHGTVTIWIDVSKMRWDEYCAEAVRWIRTLYSS